MKDYFELQHVFKVLPHCEIDQSMFIGMRCENNGVMGTITKFYYSDYGCSFEVDFDRDYIMSNSGRRVRHALIMWPSKIDISDDQIKSILDSKKEPIYLEEKTKELLTLAQSGAFMREIDFLDKPPRHENLFEGAEYDAIDYDEIVREQNLELSDYNDSAAQAHEEGWFYSDQD